MSLDRQTINIIIFDDYLIIIKTGFFTGMRIQNILTTDFLK